MEEGLMDVILFLDNNTQAAVAQNVILEGS